VKGEILLVSVSVNLILKPGEHKKSGKNGPPIVGETHYTQGSGIPELREAIAEKLKNENNLDVSPADVLVTPGAKQAIFEAICTLIEEGDEVLLLDPAWVSYEAIVKFAGGKPVMVPVSETGWLCAS